jgi:hypothetical protein
LTLGCGFSLPSQTGTEGELYLGLESLSLTCDVLTLTAGSCRRTVCFRKDEREGLLVGSNRHHSHSPGKLLEDRTDSDN